MENIDKLNLIPVTIAGHKAIVTNDTLNILVETINKLITKSNDIITCLEDIDRKLQNCDNKDTELANEIINTKTSIQALASAVSALIQ